MFAYVNKRYGIDHCAFVSTLQIRKAKSAIRDVGRYLKMDLKLVNVIAGLIPDSYYDEGEKASEITISDCLKWVPALADYKKEYPALFDIAERLEGLPTSTGIHAAGIIISPVPLTGILPLIRSEGDKEGYLCSSLDLHDSESFGCVKFDFLALGSLSVYDATEKDSNDSFNYSNDIDYDDDKVWELIGSRDTTGIFQLSSYVYKKRMPRLKPHTIDELAACLALVRGPCIMSGMDEEYMQIIEGKKQIQKLHPLYDSVVASTNGAILYQEQIMQIIVNFGFDIEISYKVMKFIAKKKVKELSAFEEEFKTAGHKNGVKDKTLDTIWKRINDCGLYSFNKSHAVAYALLAYKSAWLKVHHPVEFCANHLTRTYADKTKTRDTKLKEAFADIKRLNIDILMPDINLSQWNNTIEDTGKKKSIRLGFCSIKSFGQIAYADIKKARDIKLFESFSDFYNRVPKSKCNKSKIVAMIYAGLFSDIEDLNVYDIHKLFNSLHKLKESETSLKFGKDTINLNDKLIIIQRKILNLK